MSKITQERIRGAVARGWCHPDHSHKTLDADLALAIADEVMYEIDDSAQIEKLRDELRQALRAKLKQNLAPCMNEELADARDKIERLQARVTQLLNEVEITEDATTAAYEDAAKDIRLILGSDDRWGLERLFLRKAKEVRGE